MVAVSNNITEFKVNPSENEKSFLQDARSILAGKGSTSSFTCTGRLLALAHELLKAYQSDGNSDFWLVYDTAAHEIKRLVKLRKSIEVPAAAEEEQEDPRFTKSKNGKRIIILLSEDDIDLAPDPRYIIDDILQASTVSMLFGPSGTGKTFNALHIGYCIAHGLEWMGHKTKRGLVWYINTEGKQGLKPRTAAWRKEHGKDKTPNMKFITWPVHLTDHRQELLDTIEEAPEKPTLLIVDNYSMCTIGKNQNDQMEVTQTLEVLHEISRQHGCHCLLVHHSNWTGKVNGSAAFKNHVDTMLDLSRAEKESPIVLRCEKQRDADLFSDIRLDLKVVELWVNAETLKTITSCVVIPSDAPIRPGLSDKQQVTLDVLATGMTFAEWAKAAKEAGVSLSERTLERYRDIFISKKLIQKVEIVGKHPTYTKITQQTRQEEQSEADE